MNLLLERHAYLSDRTTGMLHLEDESFHTLERPWIRTPLHKGGMNYESCVPDGVYILQAFDSEHHHNVWSLNNAELDVFVYKPEKGVAEGRWAILIHVGNYIKDIIGCIAPGLTGDDKNVWHSKAAIVRMRELLNDGDHVLTIKPKGAEN